MPTLDGGIQQSGGSSGGSGAVSADSIWDAKGDVAVGTGADAAAVVAAGASGTVLTAGAASAISWAFPPGYEVAYAAVTADVTVSVTSEATAADVVSTGAIAYAAGDYMVEFYTPKITPGASGSVVVLLQNGATVLGGLAAPSSALQGGGTYKRKLTLSAATHTLKVTAYRTTANGTITAGAGGAAAFMPAYLRITKA